MGKPTPQGVSCTEYIGVRGKPGGTETSQYLEEKTSTEIPRVVASESGAGQWPTKEKPSSLERLAEVGDSPVGVVLW